MFHFLLLFMGNSVVATWIYVPYKGHFLHLWMNNDLIVSSEHFIGYANYLPNLNTKVGMAIAWVCSIASNIKIYNIIDSPWRSISNLGLYNSVKFRQSNAPRNMRNLTYHNRYFEWSKTVGFSRLRTSGFMKRAFWLSTKSIIEPMTLLNYEHMKSGQVLQQ